MQTYQGIIKTWKPDRGFGFIQSAASDKDIFIHIRDLNHVGYEPKIGDTVDFKLMSDKAGKIRAYDAYINGQEIAHKTTKSTVYDKNPGKPKKKLGVLFILIALIPFVFSVLLIKEQ
jgi:cold shock protein